MVLSYEPLLQPLDRAGYLAQRPSDQEQTNLSRNAMVMVRLWLPDQQGSIDIDQAVVRWVRRQEFGVQFVSLSNEADFRLATHIEQLLHRQIIDIAV